MLSIALHATQLLKLLSYLDSGLPSQLVIFAASLAQLIFEAF